mmetsp:Transcript_6119/g.8554  ORF Transcript_6119/g.8554 Transcript_6119/m.8554 type:complete len:406 (-) Transcript_6119:368-1585(-)
MCWSDRAVEERLQALSQPHPLRDQEGQLQRLVPVESRVAGGLVAPAEVLHQHLVHVAPDAFRHVLSRHLQVHAARVSAHLGMHVEEGPQLVPYPLKGSRLVSVVRLDGVAVHRVRAPQHRPPLPLHGPDELGQVLPQLLGPHPDDHHHPARDVVRVHRREQLQQLLRTGLVRHLDAHRIAHSGHEVQMCVVQLAGSLAHPQHVRRAVVPAVGDGVLAGQRLLVGQQQALMGRVEVALSERGRPGVHADGLHEAQTLVHLGAHLAVSRAGRQVLHEVEVPGVESGDIGISAHGKGSEDVEGLRGLVVSVQHALRIVHAGLGRELLAVDDVAAVGRQRHAASHFVRLCSGLGKLACHAADFDDRHRATEGQHQGHLEDHSEGVSHVVHAELAEGLGTIASHEKKSLA